MVTTSYWNVAEAPNGIDLTYFTVRELTFQAYRTRCQCSRPCWCIRYDVSLAVWHSIVIASLSSIVMSHITSYHHHTISYGRSILKLEYNHWCLLMSAGNYRPTLNPSSLLSHSVPDISFSEHTCSQTLYISLQRRSRTDRTRDTIEKIIIV